MAQLDERLQNDKVLGSRQIQSKYIKAVGDAAVMIKKADGETEFFSYIKDLGADALSEGKTYIIAVSGKDSSGNEFNAGNENFKNVSGTSERLWLRMAVTVVPMEFILVALLIQNKKFIINEDYYDMMLVEIEKRKEENAENGSFDSSNGEETAETEQPENAVKDDGGAENGEENNTEN